MKIFACALTGAALMWAPVAGAVEITGGSIDLSFSAFTDDTSVRKTSLEGSVELGFSPSIGLQIDLGFNDLREGDVNARTLTLHGLYHMNEATSLGLFYAFEDTNFGNVDIVGIEAGHEMNQWDFEGYLARGDDGTTNPTFFGVSARYDLANAFGVTGTYNRIDVDGIDFSTLSVKLDRDVSDNLNLHVEVGSARVGAGGVSGSEPFVGIGGRFVFGAERGTTFGARGATRFFPGG